MKNKFCFLPFILLSTIAPLSTQAALYCNSPGYVKSVSTNHPFWDNGFVAISVLHDDGVTRNYMSGDYGDLTYPSIRAVLQLANTAYISQSKVRVVVKNSCSTYNGSDGRKWTKGLQGLWVGD